MICKYILLITFLDKLELTVKEFQVFLLNTNNPIQHYSFVCTELNGSIYWYISLTIQLNISHFFTYS